MDKTDNIINYLNAGIKAENLRQTAIASNVANMQTPGYRRVDVDFKDMLAEAIDKDGRIELDKLELGTYHPNNTPVKDDGNDVSLDYEVGQMVKNTLKHRTYTRILSKIYQQIEAAVKT